MPETEDPGADRFPRQADLLALAVLLVIVLLPRVIALAADPPTGSDLGGAFWDEGVWARNARQYVLFGRWIIDEVNPSMFVAPLYTGALAAVYQVAGVGLAQTRLLSGLSGFLTCLLLYGALRTRWPVRSALPPALVLGTAYFVVTNDRVAFTESFQLMLLSATFAAAVLALERPWWAAVSGASFALSLLAKPSAAVMGLIMAGFWLAHWSLSRWRSFQPVFSFRQPVLFCGSGGVVLLVVLVVLVLPHWAAVRQQLTISLTEAFEESGHLTPDRAVLFGWSGLGMTLNGFFREMAVLLAAVLLFATSRLTGLVRRPVDSIELLCWSWLLVGFAFLARQPYQPDRRFLFLAPALAILACLGAEAGGMALPGGRTLASLTRWRRVLVGALAGGFLGFYAQHYLWSWVGGVTAGSGLQLSQQEARSMILSAAVLAGIGLTMAGTRLLPAKPVKVPLALLVLAFVVFNPVRFALYASHLTYTLRDASLDLARLTADWGAADRVMVGGSADTFGLETQLFTFAVRVRERTGAELNADGWERYRPSLAVISMPVDQEGTRNSQRIAESHGLVAVREYRIIPDQDGTLRWKTVLLMRPELCQVDCGPLR